MGNRFEKMPNRPEKHEIITREEIEENQRHWGDLIVRIGKQAARGEELTAVEEILGLYDFSKPLAFKPTKAREKPFRITRKAARSYFVAGDPEYPEDHGFALNDGKGYSAVRFENAVIRVTGENAIAMGHYYFMKPDTGEEVEVEYSFGYQRDDEGSLEIVLHHSSLPYSPDH